MRMCRLGWMFISITIGPLFCSFIFFKFYIYSLKLPYSKFTVSLQMSVSELKSESDARSNITDNFFIDSIFKPGLLFSLSTWTRSTFGTSEFKIDQ